MTDTIDVDLCVIGAGAGGLSVAAGASQMGASVVLFEKGVMGGDCLNVGCVPSKALLAAAHAAHSTRHADRFGLSVRSDPVDWSRVRAHVKDVIATIEPMDSVARYEGFGVRVIQAEARFTGPREITGGGVQVRAKWIVLATGSVPAIPPIPGLDSVPHLTNETIFDLDVRPEHLLVLGGGPIGCELAQAHARLGCRVTLIEAARLLGADDPEATNIVHQALERDGVTVLTGATAVKADHGGSGITLTLEGDTAPNSVRGSHLLVAVGRKVGFDGLDLDRAGIETDTRGRLVLDARLRTSNRRVFAVGDAAGGPQFTHLAGQHASIVIRNTLFRLPAKASLEQVPRVTFTAPELAHVGETEESLVNAGRDFRILRWPYADNDRALAERETEGFTKLLVNRRGRVLGATVVGAAAGELIGLYGLALSKNLGVSDLTGVMIPYPTRAEVVRRAASSWYVPKLFSERTRKIVRFIMRFA